MICIYLWNNTSKQAILIELKDSQKKNYENTLDNMTMMIKTHNEKWIKTLINPQPRQ